MAGQRQKPPEMLQGKGSRYRGTSSIALLPPDAEREAPPCPRGLTKAAREWYAAFCADPLAQTVTPAAWPKVQRLARLLAKREVIERRIWKKPLVDGSMGQEAINPLLALQKELSREIEAIERGLGILPFDRVRLGLALVQRQSGLTDLRRQLDEKLGVQTVDAHRTLQELRANLRDHPDDRSRDYGFRTVINAEGEEVIDLGADADEAPVAEGAR